MKSKILTIFILLFCSSLLVAQKSVTLSDASKMTNANLKSFKKGEIKKVMFMEFFGEFITSKETSSSVMDKRYGSGSGYSVLQGIEVGEDYYETVTNEIYDLVKKIFTENGIEVLDKETLINNPDYIALGLKEEKGTRGYTGGVAKQSVTTEGIKRSVTGMGMFSETLKIMAVSKIKQMVPKIAKDNDCQAALTVTFKFGLGKKNVPTLDFIKIVMDSDVGSSGKGKNEMFFFKKGGVEIFNTKKGLVGSKDFIGDDGEPVLEKYHEEMLGLVSEMTQAYTLLLQDELK